MNPVLTTLGQRLKTLRKERKQNQSQLAEILNMSLRNYQKIEYGERNVLPQTLCFLADYYGVTTDYLLGRTDKRS